MSTRRRGYYLYKGKNFPSVSTINKMFGDKSALINWAAGQAAVAVWHESQIKRLTPEEAKEIGIGGYYAELKRCGALGSAMHSLIEDHFKGITPKITMGKNLTTAYNTFVKFLHNTAIKPDYLEKEVINPDQEYGGRFDMICTIKNGGGVDPYLKRNSPRAQAGKYIVDFKSGSYYKDDHGRQLAAYGAATFKTLNETIDRGMVIHIPRDNPENLTVQIYTKEELENYYKDFLAILECWKRVQAPKWWREERKI